MIFKLEANGENKWVIKNEVGETVGDAQRLATGYLITEIGTDNVVKRFRFIDALKEAFGVENTFENMPGKS